MSKAADKRRGKHTRKGQNQAKQKCSSARPILRGFGRRRDVRDQMSLDTPESPAGGLLRYHGALLTDYGRITGPWS